MYSHFQQDEGYVTPDFDGYEPVSEFEEPDEPRAESSPGHSWTSLIGIGSSDKPLLSSYKDEESISKMMQWLAPSNNKRWYQNDPTVVSLQELIDNLRYLLVGVPSRLFLLNPVSRQYFSRAQVAFFNGKIAIRCDFVGEKIAEIINI